MQYRYVVSFYRKERDNYLEFFEKIDSIKYPEHWTLENVSDDDILRMVQEMNLEIYKKFKPDLVELKNRTIFWFNDTYFHIDSYRLNEDERLYFSKEENFYFVVDKWNNYKISSDSYYKFLSISYEESSRMAIERISNQIDDLLKHRENLYGKMADYWER
jgi:hypothetical protein